VGWFGNESCHSRGVGSRFRAEDEVVVVVVNVVGVVDGADGGCAAVVRDDAAGGDGGLVRVSS
jgi:hypothetical protein